MRGGFDQMGGSGVHQPVGAGWIDSFPPDRKNVFA